MGHSFDYVYDLVRFLNSHFVEDIKLSEVYTRSLIMKSPYLSVDVDIEDESLLNDGLYKFIVIFKYYENIDDYRLEEFDCYIDFSFINVFRNSDEVKFKFYIISDKMNYLKLMSRNTALLYEYVFLETELKESIIFKNAKFYLNDYDLSTLSYKLNEFQNYNISFENSLYSYFKLVKDDGKDLFLLYYSSLNSQIFKDVEKIYFCINDSFEFYTDSRLDILLKLVLRLDAMNIRYSNFITTFEIKEFKVNLNLNQAKIFSYVVLCLLKYMSEVHIGKCRICSIDDLAKYFNGMKTKDFINLLQINEMFYN